MKILKLLILAIALSSLVACGDYAYGPNAPESEQIKHWGAVGSNQPVLVLSDRKSLLKRELHKFFIQPGRDQYQTVDDYIDCRTQAISPNSNPALSESYKIDECMLHKGYEFESMTGLSGRYEGYCGHELFRAKNLEFCRSTSHYQARLKAHLEAKDNPLPNMKLWVSNQSYETKILDNLDCMEIAYATSETTRLYPFHQTWGKCMDKRGYELADNVEGYENYTGFCGWKPYFLVHTEFCLSSQDSYHYQVNMKLFKDYYELHGLPNPNDTTRPGDKDKQ